MSRLVVAPRAEADLQGILEYISQDRPAAGRRLVKDLRKACQFLAEHPGAGELQPELPGKNLRTFSVRGYVIFFRPLKDGAQVVRVIHGARDWPTLF